MPRFVNWSLVYCNRVILVCIFVAYFILEEKKENFDHEIEDDGNDAKNAKKGNSLKRHQSRKDKFGQKLYESSTRRSNQVHSVLQNWDFPILAKHTLHFSFTIPLIPLIHVPPEIRQIIRSFLSLFTFDLSNFVSSPECEWDVPTLVLYIIKMVLPIVFVFVFLAWYRIGTKCTKDKRSLQNKIIGVGMFIWITTLYSLNAYQTLSAFDCTASSSGESSATLDIDPEILCYSDETHFVIIAFSTMSFTFYTLIPMCYYCCKCKNEMPPWVDRRNCAFYDDGGPCNNCKDCDYRQRYGWFYSKYHNKCFNYEFVVMLQKICISGVSLFFTTRKDVSLPMLIALNVIFIGVTAYYQPYLTDAEFLKIKRFGQKQANIQRNKKCSKQGFGVGNSLDILLLIGETCICISSLIAYSVELMMGSEAEENALQVVTANATLNGTAPTLLYQQQQDPLAERIARNYPVANAIIAIFEVLGLIIFLSGFCTFSSTFLCIYAVEFVRGGMVKIPQRN